MYFAKFDNEGNRITTYVTGIHTNIPDDAVVISEEDQKLYATNQYIRGADGKPQLKPVEPPKVLEQPNEKIDSSILALAEAIAAQAEVQAAQESRLAKLEGSDKA